MITLSDLGTLLLHAKHDPDQDNRRLAGEELAKACTEVREMGVLKEMIRTGDFHPWAREVAKKKITETALAICAEEGSLRALWDLVADPTISNPVQQLSGMKLFERLAKDGDMDGLMSLATNEACHDEPRKAAGFRIFHHHEQQKAYSALYSMAIDGSLLYEVRRTAGMRLADLCLEEGNYPLLLRLTSDERVSLNTRMDSCDHPEAAARKAIEQAVKRSDTALLSFISTDDRLPDDIRKEAKARLGALGKAEIRGKGNGHSESDLPPPRRRLSMPPPPPSTRPRKISQ